MFTAENLLDYLQQQQCVPNNMHIAVTELSGGISNGVFRIEPEQGEAFIVKQAHTQLRTTAVWECHVSRIFREIATLKWCQHLLKTTVGLHDMQVMVPQILWENAADFCYAMTAVNRTAPNWKQQLLAGQADDRIASNCGVLLGQLHARSWHNNEIATDLEDRQFFEALRVAPYYRFVADTQPEWRAFMQHAATLSLSERHALVHGDFSPKNLLIDSRAIWLIDFEVGHYGDPAFDLGFFLSHLILKAIYAGTHKQMYLTLAQAFITTYTQQMQVLNSAELADLSDRASYHLLGCLVARILGKSRVDYLQLHQQQEVVGLAQSLLPQLPLPLQEILQYVENRLE